MLLAFCDMCNVSCDMRHNICDIRHICQWLTSQYLWHMSHFWWHESHPSVTSVTVTSAFGWWWRGTSPPSLKPINPTRLPPSRLLGLYTGYPKGSKTTISIYLCQNQEICFQWVVQQLNPGMITNQIDLWIPFIEHGLLQIGHGLLRVLILVICPVMQVIHGGNGC